MQFESEKPPNGALASFSYTFKCLVYKCLQTLNGIESIIRNACTTPMQHLLDEYGQRQKYGFLQLNKSIVWHSIGEQMSKIF